MIQLQAAQVRAKEEKHADLPPSVSGQAIAKELFGTLANPGVPDEDPATTFQRRLGFPTLHELINKCVEKGEILQREAAEAEAARYEAIDANAAAAEEARARGEKDLNVREAAAEADAADNAAREAYHVRQAEEWGRLLKAYEKAAPASLGGRAQRIEWETHTLPWPRLAGVGAVVIDGNNLAAIHAGMTMEERRQGEQEALGRVVGALEAVGESGPRVLPERVYLVFDDAKGGRSDDTTNEWRDTLTQAAAAAQRRLRGLSPEFQLELKWASRNRPKKHGGKQRRDADHEVTRFAAEIRGWLEGGKFDGARREVVAGKGGKGGGERRLVPARPPVMVVTDDRDLQKRFVKALSGATPAVLTPSVESFLEGSDTD